MTEPEAAEPPRAGSPTAMATVKAEEGATLASTTAVKGKELLSKVQGSIEAAHLQDLSLPCSAVSPLGMVAERSKSVSANTVTTSRWCQPKQKQSGTLLGCPAAADDATYRNLVGAGLKSISLNAQPLTMHESVVLKEILGSVGSAIRSLDLSRGVLDASQFKPDVPEGLLKQAMEEVAKTLGNEENPEDVEKLQAAVEKFKQEYTTWEEAIQFLAKKKLDRLAILFTALQGNASLKDLNMSKNNMGAPNAEGQANYQPLRRLAKVIDVNTSIARLDLSANGFGPAGVGIVAKAMCKNISIHTLDLGGNDITMDPPEEEEDPEVEEDDPVFGEMLQGLEALSETLKKNKFLRCLSLRGNSIKSEIDEAGEDDGADTPLGKFLEPFKTYHRLSVLDLSANELGAAGARMIANALETNQSIGVLDLSDNGLGPAGLRHMARLLQNSKSLHTLVLQKNELCGKKGKRAQREALAALKEFSESVAKSGVLKHLNLSSNHLGVDFSEAVLAGVEGSYLEVLHFCSNDLCGSHIGEFDDRGLQQIIKALGSAESHKTLRELHLSGNFIQPSGVEKLTENPNLLLGVQVLDLSRNGLGNEGTQMLCSALMSSKSTVDELDLSFNMISEAKALTALLRRTMSIRVLKLKANRLGRSSIDDFHPMIDAIADRGQLEELDFSSNMLNDTHARAFIYLCRTATQPFSCLSLRDNPNISLAFAEKIIAALENNAAIKCFCITSQAGGDHEALLNTLVRVVSKNQVLRDIDCAFQVLDELDPAKLDFVRARLLANSLAAAGKQEYS